MTKKRRGEVFTFRPKDTTLLTYMRQRANEVDRSMNKWMEIQLSKMRESEKWAKEDKKENL